MKQAVVTKQTKLHVKRGDQVQVISGKAKGQQGEVLRVDPLRKVVYVKDVNMQGRHTKPRRQEEKGGIIMQEGPIHASNLLKFCPSCERGVRRVCTDNKTCRFYQKKA